MAKKSTNRPSIWRVTLPVVLLLLVLAVFWQTAGFEFTNYDDDIYVTDNPNLALGLSGPGLAWAFSTNYASNWHPLTWISLMLDYQAGGGDARTFHVTNVLLHALSVILLYLALATATKDLWRSALVAALFAVHPLRAESVAWVAERKDVLSTVFWMLALLVYVKWRGQLTRLAQLLLVIVFALGLLSKPMLVSLPLVLVLLDFWPLGRSGNKGLWALLRQKTPLIVLAAASCVVTFWAQATGGAVRPLELYPIGVRLANAAVAYVSYLGKAVWPANLAPFYPHAGATLPSWQVAGSVVFLILVSLAAVRYRRQVPSVFVGWVWYVLTLIPVIGIVQVGDQAMADRYTYVPLVGILIAVVWAVPAATSSLASNKSATRPPTWVTGALAVAVVLALAVAGHRQVALWRDSRTLFGYAVAVNSRSSLAHNNLGGALLNEAVGDESQPDIRLIRRAERHFRKSIDLKPNNVEALYNLGTALGRLGRADEAEQMLRKALEIWPDSAKARNNLGMALLERKEYTEAESHFAEAARLQPDMSQAHNNLGYALYRQRRYEEAIPPIQEALRISPDYVQAHINVGNALMRLSRFEEAASHYVKVLDLEPDRIKTRNNLATAYEHLGRTADALAQLEIVLRQEPDNPVARARYEKLLGSSR